jgi:hypothetical protein
MTDLSMKGKPSFREGLYLSDLKESEYTYPLPAARKFIEYEGHEGAEGEDHEGDGAEDAEADEEEKKEEDRRGPLFIYPPDFTFHQIRSGENIEDLYRIIASGIGGTAMPTWRDSITEEQIWGMAHYVAHLVDLKNNEPAELKALRDKLTNQPEYVAPETPASVPASASAPSSASAPASAPGGASAPAPAPEAPAPKKPGKKPSGSK